MDHVVSSADRAAFKRCRRQWDFTAITRQHLRPLRAQGPDLDRAMRDALAVYYFPGMWDWASAIVLPLVSKGLDDSVARQRAEQGSGATSRGDDATWDALLEQGHTLLERYVDWAPTVDRFSPIRVESDFDALVADPADPDSGLVDSHGAAIRYTGRIHLLATDEHDRYWIVRHQVTDGPFQTIEQLVLDEEQVASCWAWERFYDGMEISGTIYNEMSTSALDGDAPDESPDERPRAAHPRGGLPQNEPSGGGRGVASVRRTYVRGREDETVDRIRQAQSNGFRRTVIRRSRREISEAGRCIAEEAIDMVRDDLRVYPNVAAHCAGCAFVAPCLAVTEGRDVESILSDHYRPKEVSEFEMGRLGGSPFGVGRGWVPPPRGTPQGD